MSDVEQYFSTDLPEQPPSTDETIPFTKGSGSEVAPTADIVAPVYPLTAIGKPFG